MRRHNPTLLLAVSPRTAGAVGYGGNKEVITPSVDPTLFPNHADS